MPLPRELGRRCAIPRAVANIEEASQRAEGDFAVRRALERKVRLFNEIEEVVVPDIHPDDAPAAGEGLGEGGNLGHQPAPARSLGSRTRLYAAAQKVKAHPTRVATPEPGRALPCDGLDPTERFLDLLADAQVNRIAAMARRPSINR